MTQAASLGVTGLSDEAALLVRGRLLVNDGRGQRGSVFTVTNPATGDVLCHLEDAGEVQAVQAVDAASAAAEGWARTPSRQRSEVLAEVHRAIIREVDGLADLIVAENGKARADATAEVRYAADFFGWYAEEAVRNGGSYGPSPAGGSRTLVTSRPVGVAALVTPWNFPAAMIARKVAPALAAGCTVVLKPAAETPLTALAIAKLATLSGVPAGVINVVPSTDAAGVVSSWLNDDRIRKLSFTGSTLVGRRLLTQSAQRVLNASMELGGNAPFIVLEDADVAAAVDGAMVAKFRGGGQACTAANRFFVHEAVADHFAAELGSRVQQLKVGPGAAPTTDIGPLISGRSVDRVQGLVDEAVDQGAIVVAQSSLSEELIDGGGHYFAPVVLDRVDAGSRIVQEEIFGPVAPIVRWSDPAEMLALVNCSEMGLAAYIYSRDLARALHLGEQLEAGMVGVNRAMVSDAAAPFGGLKQSGLGREGARHGLEEYQEIQYLSVEWPR